MMFSPCHQKGCMNIFFLSYTLVSLMCILMLQIFTLLYICVSCIMSILCFE